MYKILVTGGAGFIGSNLCKKLLADKKNEVVCLDNLYTGRLSNIEDLFDYSRFKFIKHDITEEIPFDYYNEIYNLACPASPPAYQADPIGTLKTNFIGMLNVLKLADKTGAKVLQTSTSEVYGDPKEHPQPETYRGNVNPDGIRACYDEGKRVAETLCFDYMRTHGTDVKVVRIFNTYGPNMDPEDGRVVSNFICQALRGDYITVYGDGSQTRSFCYVSDMVTGLIAMMASKEHGPINLGNPGEFTVNELAEKVIKMTDTNSNIVFKDLPSDDPTVRRPCIDLANSKLNWTPKVQLNEGLLNTINYFRNEINKVRYE